MKISYKTTDFTEPGDSDLLTGIDCINAIEYKHALEHFEKAAEQDNEYALLFAACIYYMGFDNINRETSKAVRYFQKLAKDFNNRIAQHYLGMIHLCGEGLEKSNEKSKEWLTLSANNGYIDAQAELGVTYNAEMDSVKTIFWHQKGAEWIFKDGDDDALNLFYQEKFKINFDDKIMPASSQNRRGLLDVYYLNPTALAHAYKFELKEEAKELLKLDFWYAMTNSNGRNTKIRCQIYLGLLYFFGNSWCLINDTKALLWFKKAAGLGNSYAQFQVGVLYQEGLHIQRNYKEAMKWYRKAKQAGIVEALIKMGELYYSGLGVKKDFKQANFYFEAFLKVQENLQAYDLIGNMYAMGGYGIKKDAGKAKEYYKKGDQLQQSCNYANKDAGKAKEYYKKGDQLQQSCNYANKDAMLSANKAGTPSAAGMSSVFNAGLLSTCCTAGVLSAKRDGHLLQQHRLLVKGSLEYQASLELNKNGEEELSLGLKYFDGKGVKQDTERALELFEEARTKGCKDAQPLIDEINMINYLVSLTPVEEMKEESKAEQKKEEKNFTCWKCQLLAYQ